MRFNLPTWLTLFRFLLVPAVGVLMCVEFPGRDKVVAAAFVIAAVTDWFDGWLARRWQQESAFGAFLDPVADKLIVCTVLVLLIYQDPRLVVAVPVVVIIGRELTISALREWMAEKGARAAVAVGAAGKYKTTLQMIALVFLLLDLSAPRGLLYTAGLVLLWASAVLTVWSMLQYIRAAWPVLKKSSNDAS